VTDPFARALPGPRGPGAARDDPNQTTVPRLQFKTPEDPQAISDLWSLLLKLTEMAQRRPRRIPLRSRNSACTSCRAARARVVATDLWDLATSCLIPDAGGGVALVLSNNAALTRPASWARLPAMSLRGTVATVT